MQAQTFLPRWNETLLGGLPPGTKISHNTEADGVRLQHPDSSGIMLQLY